MQSIGLSSNFFGYCMISVKGLVCRTSGRHNQLPTDDTASALRCGQTQRRSWRTVVQHSWPSNDQPRMHNSLAVMTLTGKLSTWRPSCQNHGGCRGTSDACRPTVLDRSPATVTSVVQRPPSRRPAAYYTTP